MKAAVALALRLVLGAFWIWAGSTKIVGHFDAGPFLSAAVSRSTVAPEAVRLALAGAIGHVALPHVVAVNLVVPWLELAAGLSILLGIATAWGLPARRRCRCCSSCAGRSVPIHCCCSAPCCWRCFTRMRAHGPFMRRDRLPRLSDLVAGVFSPHVPFVPGMRFFSCQAREIFKREFKKLTSGEAAPHTLMS
ncbi:DoxX family protein [Burkholderia sp. FXe9]|nr:DoxX family protein [Burkholderia sp. FXe9]